MTSTAPDRGHPADSPSPCQSRDGGVPYRRAVPPPHGSLRRQLGLASAVVVGAGSMVGAGVFTAWGPAADAAGTALLVGLAVAAVVAFANATSSARLAAVHPESGGTYVYARRQLSPAWGHLAGWGFVVGKTASCAAMALTAGAYLWPGQERLVGAGRRRRRHGASTSAASAAPSR